MNQLVEPAHRHMSIEEGGGKVDFPRQTKDTRTKGTSPGNIHIHRHSDLSMACTDLVKVHLCSVVRIP
ncbi:hypothetical protein XELAEV_18000564mg [Xenopus laevis]|nr:hypothetical protein XELAEV_18000564mg [Xenopus laevis]